VIADHDDALLADYVADEAAVSWDRLRRALAAQAALAAVHPVYFGSAITGAGIGEPRHFAPPTLETVVVPAAGADRAALRVALDRLAERDPLINLRQDDARQEVSVSLYGEVQKEVIQATLAADFGVDVTFRESTTICIERVVGRGEAVEVIGADPNPFLATVGLRVAPVPAGAGITFDLEVELGSMPSAFFSAVAETARETLGRGLHGWAVPDCQVTMTRSGYGARQSHAHAVFDKSMSSTAGDFRGLTPLVVMAALARAGTEVHEPLHRFRLEVPADTLGAVTSLLGRLRATPEGPAMRGDACLIEGEIPAARVHDLHRELAALTCGEGVLESVFERYEAVRGAPPPSRPRSAPDARPRGLRAADRAPGHGVTARTTRPIPV
jgi:ribosomal protection tetracycline resistance protein